MIEKDSTSSMKSSCVKGSKVIEGNEKARFNYISSNEEIQTTTRSEVIQSKEIGIAGGEEKSGDKDKRGSLDKRDIKIKKITRAIPRHIKQEV